VNKLHKLALGTVQIGQKYGLSNSSGQVSKKEARAILNMAFDHEIQVLDTAIDYGESEQTLGSLGVAKFQVITKLPSFPTDKEIEAWCKNQITQSLQRLKLKKVYGLLVHRPLQFLEEGGTSLYDSMHDAKTAGIVEKIGISVYEPRDLDRLCSLYEFDMVQLPLNIIDRRWDYWLHELHSRNIEIHVRSVFLQGLLLMPSHKRPEKFAKWACLWGNWDSWLNEVKLTPLEACLRYVLSKPEVAKVIVGVESEKQLQQIIKATDGYLPEIPSDIQTDDLQLLNPANWNKL